MFRRTCWAPGSDLGAEHTKAVRGACTLRSGLLDGLTRSNSHSQTDIADIPLQLSGHELWGSLGQNSGEPGWVVAQDSPLLSLQALLL